MLTLHPAQGRLVGTGAHLAALVGGIGSGKSMAGCARALLAGLGVVGGVRALPTPNLGMITAPTYTMLQDATLRAFLDVAGDAVARVVKSEMRVVLVNGSEVLFRSTDSADRLRGPSLAWWFGDEAALYDAQVWPVQLGRLRQFGRQGYAWLATTPRGRNWVWQVFVRDRATHGALLVHAASADNPYLDGAVLRAWRATYTGDFARQELDGAFVAFEGLVYPEFDRRLHVRTHPPNALVQVVAGMDGGFVNPGTLIVVGVDGDGRAWLLAEDVATQRAPADWAQAALSARERWGISQFAVDPAAAELLRALRAVGLPASPADNRVMAGLQVVKARLARRPDGLPRLFVSASARHTLREFEAYRWAEHRDGYADAPHKADDHALDALRYALMALDDPALRPLHAGAARYA